MAKNHWIAALLAFCMFTVWAAATEPQESCGEMERRLYLKPATTPLASPARRVEFREGSAPAAPSVPVMSLDGRWTVRLEDGREIPADVPCSIYTALSNAGVIADPYFGTNDLAAAEYGSRTSVWRRVFRLAPRAGARYRLSFKGVSDEAEFSLNGKCLGRHIGMFGGPDFTLGGEDLRSENVLEVRLFPVRPSRNTVSLMCVRGGHYCNLPSMGVWQGVSVEEVPDVEVRRQFAATLSAAAREIDYRVDISAARSTAGELALSVRPVGFSGKSFRFSERVALKAGENALRYRFALPGAELWWPVGHGAARTYEITAAFGGSSRTDAFGIRTFRLLPGPGGARTNLYNRVAEVNGKRLFLKGAGWCTCDALLRLDEAMYRRMLNRAVEQGVNFLRAWGLGLVETDEFYRQCDRSGLLVLQEMPTHSSHGDVATHRPLIETTERSVVRLRNHPSLAVWGGGNELAPRKNPMSLINDELLTSLGRVCCELDGTRDFWRTDPWAGSEHHHISWSGLTPSDFLVRYARRPGICQNEYGLDTLMNVESLRRIAPPEERDMYPWRRFTAMSHHTATFNHDYIVNKARRPKGSDVDNFTWFGSLYLPQHDLESFVRSSQIAQVYATAMYVYCARTQFPWTGMYIYYKLNDVFPGSSWSVVDWFGSPKLAHYALKRAQRPLCAAPRLAGHEPGASARIPFFLIDEAGTLRNGSKWEVSVSFYDSALAKTAERRFAGTGPAAGGVLRLGDATSDPARPLTSPSLVAWTLAVDGETVADDFAMLNVYGSPERCAGYAKTALAASVDGEGRLVVSNVGGAAAVGVMIDAGRAADTAVLDDNFFFLSVGESRTLAAKPPRAVRSVSALNAAVKEIEQCN